MHPPLPSRRSDLSRVRRKHLTRASFVSLASALSLPLVAFLAPSSPAANSQSTVTTGTDLTAAATYGGTLPTSTSDVIFNTGYPTVPTTFTLNSSLAIGTLNDTNASAITISNNGTTASTLTLSTAANSFSGTAADLLYVGGSSNLTIQGANGGSTAAATLTLALGANGNFAAATGGTLSIGAQVTGGKAIVLRGGGTINFTGGTSAAPSSFNKFTITTGTTVGSSGYINASGANVGVGDGGTVGNLNVTGGVFNAATAGTTFFAGSGAGATGTINVSGGTLNVINALGSTTGASNIYFGGTYNGTGGSSGVGILNISGTGVFSTSLTTGTFQLGSSTGGTGTGTINLNGGTLSANRAFTAGGGGAGAINFNGGTLQALGTALAIPTTITTTVQDGGGTIDSQTFAVTIATNFTHGGTAATDGGLKIASSAGTPGQVILSGVLGQTGGLTINSAAYLQNTNTYAGATSISAFVDANNASALGATGTGNGTSINTGGTFRFRDVSNRTIAEALTFNGGTFLTYNAGGTTTLSGAVTLNAATVISVSPQAQASTTLLLSGGIADGATTGNNLVFSRVGAAAAASNDVVNITGASTYGGTTAITDALTTNTGTFSVRLSGGDNRLPVGTVLTLGGTAGGGNAAGSGRLILGDTTNGASNQTLTGLVTSGTGTNNAVVGGATANSTLTLNIAVGTTNTYAGLLGGAAANANNLALTKGDAGTLTLTNANPYTGATTVSAGTLIVNGSINGSTSVTVTGGALTLGNTAATVLADMGTLSLSSNTALNLNANGGTEVIAALILNGNSIGAGTYSASALQSISDMQGYNITFSSSNNELLMITPVPEPATVLGGALLVAVFGWHLCSRRRQAVA